MRYHKLNAYTASWNVTSVQKILDVVLIDVDAMIVMKVLLW